MKSALSAGVAGPLSLSVFLAAPVAVAAEDPLTIVVTASRYAETVDHSLAPVSVIRREDIERSNATTLPEILTTVPGVVISRNGGAGQNTSLFLRGTESDQVLVLIDGVKAGSATLGTTPFQDIPLAQVEKVEVVRGPRSSLYGSEAIGGVVHIFTRRGGDGLEPSFSIGGGTHDTAEVAAGVSGGGDRGWYSVHASSYTTEGFNVCRGSFDAGCFTVEPDDDGYDNTALSLRGGGRVGENLVLDAALLDSASETEFDGSFQNNSETRTRVGHVKGSLSIGESWSSSLLLARSTDESENFLDDAFASRFETNRDQLSWQNDIALGKSEIVVGVDYTDDEVESDTPFAVDSRDNTGVFASFRSAVAGLDYEFSLRNDDNEQFGSETTGGIAVGRNLVDTLRATFSYGTAFKAPTFNELYFPDFGNPDLAAETAESYDIGLSGGSGSRYWSVNLFHTVIENLIAYDPTAFAPANIGEAEINGVELATTLHLGEWRLEAALTLQDPEDTGGSANDGNQLPRRAKEILHFAADRDYGRWSLGASVHSQGDSFDDPGNLTELDGFTVVNLRGAVSVHRNWELGLQVNNVLDEEYETAAFYRQDGLNVMATLRYVTN